MSRSTGGRVLVRICALSLATAALGIVATRSAAAPTHPISDSPMSGSGGVFGAKCEQRRATSAKARCYIALLLADIEASHNPARELPRLDAEARAAGGFIAGACHPLMHAVGRAYARRHHVTLATLQKYLPRSDDPGCSAGFGHGLIMALGPQILKMGPRGVVRTCERLDTRMRQYSCIHGLGHAYMRVYGDYLRFALPACRALGRRSAQDCAQGAFHDYWIATSGRDATKRRPGLITSPRMVCGAQKRDFVLACWYRVYVERPPAEPVQSSAEIDRLCSGLRDVQRAGCVAAAALSAATADPFSLVQLCAHLTGNDIVNCLRAVPVEEVERRPARQLGLIRACSRLQTSPRQGCYRWFGTALTVVTNGAFGKRCVRLETRSARFNCRAGAHGFRRPLVTFA